MRGNEASLRTNDVPHDISIGHIVEIGMTCLRFRSLYRRWLQLPLASPTRMKHSEEVKGGCVANK